MEIVGYRILRRLCETRDAETFRAVRLADGEPVLVEVFRQHAASPERLVRAQEELDLVTRLALPGIQKVYSWEQTPCGWVMAREDIGGDSLAGHLRRGRLSLPEALRVGVGLCGILDLLRRRGLIHKNVRPSHVFWNPETQAVRLGGLESGSTSPEALAELRGPWPIGEALLYLSPEQTGRMNRTVDSRSDLYSLGATLYAALTGAPPFTSDDPVELVHSLVARTPQPPHERAPEIPRAVSDIIMRLLEKDAEARYQSASGVAHDLEACLAQLEASAAIEPFELGRADVSPTLRIPQTLYGRSGSRQKILAAFERACKGEARLLLLAGNTGVGKTALVREIQRPVAVHHGYFAEGKFEQYQHGAPYHAWIVALSVLANELLTEPSSRLEAERARLQRAIEGNGRVLTDVVPALEKVLGPQSPVPELSGIEAQNRFNRTFQRFVRSIADAEHLLVIFLDDLQWTDPASLRLMQALFMEPLLHHFLLIGAYRDNEVDASHPLSLAVDKLERESAQVERETLQPLTKEDVHALLTDALRRPAAETRGLAGVIYAKAGGNPFFTRQILRTLMREALLHFDPSERRWVWDLDAIRSQRITDNVVEILTQRLRQLPDTTERLLRLAACVGHRFPLSTLARVADVDEGRALEELLPALEQELLVSSSGEFVFAHDRVQQAAYSLIPPPERPSIHWRIGSVLLLETKPEEREQVLFEIVNQLNQGASLHGGRAELLQLADWNARAGRRALASAAFVEALNYFEEAIRYVGAQGWTDAYATTLALHQQATAAACLCGRYDRMRELGNAARQNARSLLDQSPIEESEIKALTAQGRLLPAIRLGLHALERLGLRLPEAPTERESKRRLEATLALLEQVGVDGVLRLPEMTSPEQLVRTSILSQLGEPAYAAAPGLFISWASLMAELSLRHGNSFLSPFAYAAYALALCASEEHVERGYGLAKAAIRLMEQRRAESLRCKVLNIFGCTIQPWMEHIRNCMPVLEEATAAGAATGDFTSASYSAFNCCSDAFFQGEPLGALEERINRQLGTIAGLRQTYIHDWVAVWGLTVRHLRGDTGPPAAAADFDETRWLAAAHSSGDHCGLAYYFLGKLIGAFLLEEGGGEGVSAEVLENLAGFQGSFAVPVFYFYDSLALLRRDPSATHGARVRENQRKLQQLSMLAPMNFQHKRDLVEAEIVQADGQEWQAAQLYERAVAGARRHRFVQEEGLACERAGRFYLARGMEETARLHLERARDCFAAWQAGPKVTQLESLLSRSDATRPVRKLGDTAPDSRLDVRSVMKAALAISSEIELENLLVRLVTISIENAGARYGALILEENGQWVVRVHHGVEESSVPGREPVGLEECGNVSAAIVRFVARTGEAVILDDASRDRLFAQDPHVRRHGCLSVLCAPILSRGGRLGVLYLENELTRSAFSQERLRVLEMLAAQAATSIENARAYQALRESEAEYRRIVDTAFEGIWVLNKDAATTFVNARMAEMLGYSRAELSGRPVTDFMLEEDVPDHARRMEERRQGLSEIYERRLRRRDGNVLWVLASATPCIDEEGRFQGSFAMFTDITARKEAEAQLRQLNRELRALSTCNESLMRAADEPSLVREICEIICTEAGCGLAWVGYVEQDGDTMTLRAAGWGGLDDSTARFELSWSDEGERAGAAANAIRTGRTAVMQDVSFEPEQTPWRRGATRRDCRAGLALPLHDERGRVFGVLVICLAEAKQITQEEILLMEELSRNLAFGIGAVRGAVERRRAEKAVRDSQRRLALLVQSAPVAIVVHGPEGRIRQANAAASEMLGMSDRRMEGRERDDPVWRFVREDGTEMPAEEYPVARVLADSQALRNLVVGVRRPKGGKVAWMLVNAVPLLEPDGAIAEVTVMFMDITDRKRVEEELRDAARRKDDFMAMLGHELRNPLTPICTASHILKVLGSPDPRAQRAHETIERQALHMSRLVDDLLNMSRVARGKIALQRERIDFVALVRTTVQDLADQVERRGLALGLRLPDESVWVWGDVTRLSQVVSNLVLNAIKFTERCGRIHVEVTAPTGHDSFVSLTVEDTGVGMSPDTLDRLFTPFVQADAGIARTRGGLGLGLALVKGLVSLHGGTVEAASQGVGRGSRFTVRLPTLDEKTAGISSGTGRPHREGMLVLVVEDDAETATSLRMFLEMMGQRVEIVSDGPAALAVAHAFNPDVIVCDTGISGAMDAFAFARAVRADPDVCHARLIALTREGEAKKEELAREAGFDVRLSKPADIAALGLFLAGAGESVNP